ncbi:MAG: hypothetical protein U1F43_33125 [Myxococcota bacterium]
MLRSLLMFALAASPLACDVYVEDPGPGPGVYDSDNDGLTDAEEVNDVGTDPYAFDTDRDGLGDACDDCLDVNSNRVCDDQE